MPSSEAVPERTRGRRGISHGVVVIKIEPTYRTTRAKISWNDHKNGIAGVIRTQSPHDADKNGNEPRLSNR
jgi:hypothetical protein